MFSLVLDSANRDLNIGLAKDGVLLDRISYQAWQRQSELMVKEIDNILKRNHLTAKDIHDVIVTIGPGSYTGIRIALTIAKTLAYALNIKIYAISSLLAQNALEKKTISVINARSNRSYVAIYDENGSALVEETVWPNDELLAWVKNGNDDFVISGDAKYLGVDSAFPDVLTGMIKAKSFSQPVDNVLTLKPIYLKDLL